MWVKVCGITNESDAVSAADAGADAVGLNFVGGPRRIDGGKAREIVRALPVTVTPVALIRLQNGQIAETDAEALAAGRINHLQLYGEWTAGTLLELISAGYRPIPVIAVKDAAFAESFQQWGDPNSSPAAIVLDAYDPTREGGTGKSFHWEWVVQARSAAEIQWPPIVLAGGLTPDNVADAIRTVQPYGVDVASGVEVAGSPGKKDRDKLAAFVHNAKAAAP